MANRNRIGISISFLVEEQDKINHLKLKYFKSLNRKQNKTKIQL